MIDAINANLEVVVGILWSLPTAVLLVATGLGLTIFLGFPQIRGFRHAIDVARGKYDRPDDPGEITHFQALSTALSGTVGLGNIAGVAVAVKMGGPGAVVWMILAGLIGMSTKYAECSLAVMYRRIDEKGRVHGGPMYYILLGLGKAWKPMAIFFAIMCVGATFGAANMFQSNQVASIVNQYFHVPKPVTGVLLAILVAVVLLGGLKRISRVTSILVPLMGGLYILGALVVIGANISEVPAMFGQIFEGAFMGTAAAGGAAGAAIKTALVQGLRRASFSNEAGIGTAPIVHSAAATKEPIREGMVALFGPLIDTVIICTMTALVIISSGLLATQPELEGVALTAAAFDAAIPGFGHYFLPIAVTLFAYSTIISWTYYGDRAISFVFKNSELAVQIYKVVFCIAVFVGAVWTMTPVLNFSDICVALMIAPNLLAVVLLFPKLKAASEDYFKRLKNGDIKPVR